MACSNVRDTIGLEDKTREAYLLTGVTVYKGALIVRDTATGYDKPAVTGTGLIARGIAAMEEPSVSTSGIASGTTKIRLRKGIFCLDNYVSDSCTVADRGKPCYIVDDCTVARTDGGATRSVAGTIENVDTRGVWVLIDSVNGVALASEIASREAISTALALTTTPGGASYVGVFDTAGKYTATNVEAALAEDADARRVKVNTTSNTVGSIPVIHRIAVPSGESGTVSVTLDATFGKVKIIDAHFIKDGSTGGASDTVKITDGTYDISDAMALSGKAAGAIVRAASISTTYDTLAAGATLVANYTKSTTSCEGTLYVRCLRVS